MNVDEEEFPLEIIELGTGSLLLELLGKSEVIKAISELLKGSYGVFYKSKTPQGKLEAIPKQIETIAAAVRLKEILEANKIDTKNMTRNIEESAISVTEQLKILLSGERSIKVDGEIILTSVKQQKQIAGTKTPLLEASKEIEADDSNPSPS